MSMIRYQSLWTLFYTPPPDRVLFTTDAVVNPALWHPLCSILLSVQRITGTLCARFVSVWGRGRIVCVCIRVCVSLVRGTIERPPAVGLHL